MKRNSHKVETAQSVTDLVVYDREYDCPNYGMTAVYTEAKTPLSPKRLVNRWSTPALMFPFLNVASRRGDALAEEHTQ